MGIIPDLLRRFQESQSEYVKEEIYKLMSEDTCPECLGQRLNPSALSIKIVGKNIAVIFEKTSTRTRCAFEVGAMDLGMGVTYLGPTGSQMGKKESIADTARVLGRMFDGIEYRGFGQEIVEELAKYVKERLPNAKILIHQTWPYEDGGEVLKLRTNYSSNQKG